MSSDRLSASLTRIAEALERLSPPPPTLPPSGLGASSAWIWNGARLRLEPSPSQPAAVAFDLLTAIDAEKRRLFDNVERFARGSPAHDALLWGARGMGKSSLVKAVHGALAAAGRERLRLVEIHRDDIAGLTTLMTLLRDAEGDRIVIFCDDLSFEAGDDRYKSLKAALEGGLCGRPSHLLFCVTSNRRHLLPREMIDNEKGSAIHPGEAEEEKVSLSDRFGLWIGFHPCTQRDYLAIVERYVDHYGFAVEAAVWREEALRWAQGRGGRSGRTARQFIQDYGGRLGMTLDDRDRRC